MESLIEKVGRGALHVSGAQEIAAFMAEEAGSMGAIIPALKALGSLGGGHTGNVERDWNRWLKGLYGFELEPYKLSFDLKVPCPVLRQIQRERITLIVAMSRR